MTECEGGLPVTRVAALMLLASVVTACASVDNKDSWWKSGMTKDEFARDDDQCRQMTTVQSQGAVVAGTRVRPSAEVDENAYTICMEAAGYEKVPKDVVPPK
jgi:major membrane immunogen (membrane-anchored lipoprotein)